MRDIIITNPAHINFLSKGKIIVKRGNVWLVELAGKCLVLEVSDFDWI